MMAFSLARLPGTVGRDRLFSQEMAEHYIPLSPQCRRLGDVRTNSQMTPSSQIRLRHSGYYLGIEAYSKHCARCRQ